MIKRQDTRDSMSSLVSYAKRIQLMAEENVSYQKQLIKKETQ
jgi:hypothetical protein